MLIRGEVITTSGFSEKKKFGGQNASIGVGKVGKRCIAFEMR